MRRSLPMGLTAIAALVCLGLPTDIQAQDQPAEAPQQARQRPQNREGATRPQRQRENLQNLTDAQFLQRAAASGMMEVGMAKLVSGRTDNEAIQQLADQMITDHNEANSEIVRLAESKSVDIPHMLSDRQKEVYDRFSGMDKGQAFEAAYLQNQIRAHQRAINLFATKAENAKDADIKAFARKTEPILRRHLERIQQLAGSSAPETGARTPPVTPAPEPNP